MHKNTLLKQAGTGAFVALTLVLFVWQARLALKPMPIELGRPEVAYGYDNVNVSGTVYTNEGVTNIGANKTVALSINGAAIGAQVDDTDSSGAYTISGVNIATGAVLTLFLNDETEDAVTLTLGNGRSLTGIDLYQNHLIVRSDSGSMSVTNTNLDTGNNSGDSDIGAIYGFNGSTMQVANGKELFVWTGDTYIPGGRVASHDVEVRGTMTMAGNGLTISGSFLASNGIFTTSTGILLTSISTTESLTMGSNSVQNITIDNGLVGYWKLDDLMGLRARDSSRAENHGTLTNGPVWSGSTLPTTYFYNGGAIGFDGTDDYIVVTDSTALRMQDFTLASWVNLDTSNSAVFISKEISTSSGNAYVLWRESGQLRCLSDNGSVLSYTTTLNTSTWYHIACAKRGTTLTLYLNGQSVATQSVGATITYDSNNVFIGGDDNDGNNIPDFGLVDGRMDDVRIYNRGLSTSEILSLAQGHQSTGSGTYVLGSGLDVNGNLDIRSGGLDVSETNYGLTVAGHFFNVGEFIKQSGTVTLDGTQQTVSGSTIFNAFIKSTAVTDTLYFDYTGRQSFSGSLTLQGASSGTQLFIRSTRNGSGARILLDGSLGTSAQTIRYLNVKNSTASGGNALTCLQSSEGCTNSGSNFNWLFAGCGDGEIESGLEQCDDGDVASGDGCSSSCTIETGFACVGEPSVCSATCGDGIEASVEQCDDGNMVNDDECTNSCADAGCGDGVVRTGENAEICDDGNSSNQDACLNNCTLPICGDGYVRAGVEECEPPDSATCANNCLFKTGGGGGGGNTAVSSATSQTYSRRAAPPEGCGNGVLQTDKGEECDRGRFNGLGDCSYECKQIYCGDGIISPEVGEECEPIPISTPDGQTAYQTPSCGEVCTAPDTAKGRQTGCKRFYLPSCEGGQAPLPIKTTAAFCGNGKLEVGEECDDGRVCVGGERNGQNATSDADEIQCVAKGGKAKKKADDGCTAACKREFCGDALVQQNGTDGVAGNADDEQCDNGSVCNNDATHSCRTNADCRNGGICAYNKAKEDTCGTTCKKISGTYTFRIPLRSVSIGTHTLNVRITDSTGNSISQSKEFTVDQIISMRLQNDIVVGGNTVRSWMAQVLAPDMQVQLILNKQKYTQKDTMVLTVNVKDSGGFPVSGLQKENFSIIVDDRTLEDIEKAPSLLPVCGNSAQEQGEQCDDGNTKNGDGCNAECLTEEKPPVCGDGKVNTDEQCDDGNRENGDGCTAACMTEVAENVQPGICGNGIQEGGEGCDTGSENSDITPNACRTTCTPARCGDYIVDANEQCDGSLNCTAYCEELVAVACGNGRKEQGEECDDGNTTSADGCSEACITETLVAPAEPICGNARRETNEECDDGNGISGDGCSACVLDAIAQSSSSEGLLPAAPSSASAMYAAQPFVPVIPLFTGTVIHSQSQGPIGDTGPAFAGMAAVGAAAGVAWMRRKRHS